jgi:hypothetical protein
LIEKTQNLNVYHNFEDLLLRKGMPYKFCIHTGCFMTVHKWMADRTEGPGSILV